MYTPHSTNANDLQRKFDTLRNSLNDKHQERYEEIDISLTALLSGFHVAMIGAPGSAKSMLAEDLTDAFEGSSIFKVQINQFSTPEEIYGPLNVSLLKEGRYEHVIEGYLPTAELAYVDEFFNANSSLQNAFLLAMNERKFKQGNNRIDIPLVSLIASSNHFPQGEDLWALWDRFHFRRKVEYIHEPGNFVKMVKGTEHFEVPSMSMRELKEAQSQVSSVHIPEDLYDRVLGIRGDLDLEGILVSDRRYRQAMRALQAFAWLDGRETVDDIDFGIMTHMLWSREEDIKTVSKVVLRHTNPLDLAAEEIIDAVDEIASNLASALAELKNTGAEPSEALHRQGVEWFHKTKQMAKEVKKLRVKADESGRRSAKVEEAKNRLVRTSKEIARLLKIDMDED